MPRSPWVAVDSWQRSLEAGVDPSGRQPAPSVVELERARDLWDDHPLAGAGGLIAHCMAEAAVEAERLFVVSDAERHVAAHPGRRAAAQPRG